MGDRVARWTAKAERGMDKTANMLRFEQYRILAMFYLSILANPGKEEEHE